MTFVIARWVAPDGSESWGVYSNSEAVRTVLKDKRDLGINKVSYVEYWIVPEPAQGGNFMELGKFEANRRASDNVLN